MVAYPDGSLADYLDSLKRLTAVVAESDATSLLPGHGPAVADPAQILADYLPIDGRALSRFARPSPTAHSPPWTSWIASIDRFPRRLCPQHSRARELNGITCAACSWAGFESPAHTCAATDS